MLPLDQAWGTPATMSSQNPLLQPFYALQPTDAGPFFLPNTGYGDADSIHPESGGSVWLESPAAWDILPLSSQGSCYLELSSLLPPLLHRGVSGSSAGSPTVAIEMASSSVGSSAASSSSASCQMGGTPDSSIWVSFTSSGMGAGGVSSGLDSLVCPSWSSCWGVTPSWMASSVKVM